MKLWGYWGRRCSDGGHWGGQGRGTGAPGGEALGALGQEMMGTGEQCCGGAGGQ